jgi:aminoglycoside phosphotransferase (APT) family kinase protein
MEISQQFIRSESLADVETAGQGLECLVYKATSSNYGSVVLKVPRVKVYQNANDFNVEAKDLIQQEMRIYTLLQDGPVPVPKPYKYLEEDDYPAMLCEYVDDDGTDITFEEMGRVAALIHSTPLSVPVFKTVALETSDVFSTMEQRMQRRFSVLSKTVPEASSWIQDWSRVHTILEGLKRFPSTLLHMDFRDVNLRHSKGRISAVIDWTNALIGPAAIDIYHTLEFSQPGEGFVKGYSEITDFPEVTVQEEWLLRLDAALVLALVFTSEAPDPVRGATAVARAKELSESLLRSTLKSSNDIAGC